MKSGSIAAAVDEFVTVGISARGLCERTRVEYARDLREMEVSLRARGIVRLAEVHGGHFSPFLAVLEAHGNSPATRRRKALAIRSFFRFLIDEGIIAQNPADRMALPRVPRREPRFLTESSTRNS
jgi:integrase/recombinase XerD